jgi:hypothetical protein
MLNRFRNIILFLSPMIQKLLFISVVFLIFGHGSLARMNDLTGNLSLIHI